MRIKYALAALTLSTLLLAGCAKGSALDDSATVTTAPGAPATPQPAAPTVVPQPTTPPAPQPTVVPTCPSCSIPPAPTVVPAPQPPVPQLTPQPQRRLDGGDGGSASNGCIPTALVSGWIKAGDSVGDLIAHLNEEYERNNGNVGATSDRSGFQITNLGKAGAVVFWTDTVHRPIRMLDGNKPIRENIFHVLTQGSWGTRVAFAPFEVPTPGRWARLCDRITDLQAVFPGAFPTVNP